METKKFPTADALSAITGRMMTEDFSRVHEVLTYMAGEEVFTHQLPRISREAQKAMLAYRPDVQEAIDDAAVATIDNWQDIRDTWIARYGETLDVPQMNADEHERIDPMSELVEHVHPDKIVTLTPTQDTSDG